MMRATRQALSCFALLLAGCAPSDPQQQVSSALAQQVMLPAYSAWTASNRQLADSATNFCAGSQDITQARQVWLAAQSAWAALQPMAAGPLNEGNRAWQVQFWPDKKNLVARQVETLLNSKPQLSQTELDQASVVVQGLSAYEYVLFDPAIDLADSPQKARYCPLLIAIGQHQQQLADSLLTQVTALDGLKKKLATPLGRQSNGQPQPYQAESWRSDSSLGNLSASLSAAQNLWQGKDQYGLRHLLKPEQQELAKRIDAAYANTKAQLDGLSRSLKTLLASEDDRAQLGSLYEQLDQLHRLHERELAKALGVQLGFNAHDGD